MCLLELLFPYQASVPFLCLTVMLSCRQRRVDWMCEASIKLLKLSTGPKCRNRYPPTPPVTKKGKLLSLIGKAEFIPAHPHLFDNIFPQSIYTRLGDRHSVPIHSFRAPSTFCSILLRAASTLRAIYRIARRTRVGKEQRGVLYKDPPLEKHIAPSLSTWTKHTQFRNFNCQHPF